MNYADLIAEKIYNMTSEEKVDFFYKTLEINQIEHLTGEDLCHFVLCSHRVCKSCKKDFLMKPVRESNFKWIKRCRNYNTDCARCMAADYCDSHTEPGTKTCEANKKYWREWVSKE